MALDELEKMLGKTLSSIEYLDPGYDGHATDVWRVRAGAEYLIVRASRIPPGEDIESEGGPFWGGVSRMFGHDPRDGGIMQAVFERMEGVEGFRVPHLYARRRLENRDALLVEAMPGAPLKEFETASRAMLEDFGRSLARQHKQKMQGWGTANASALNAPKVFPTCLEATLRFLVDRWYRDDEEICSVLEEACERARSIAMPFHSCLVMIDQDPSQYLTDGKKITALVDLDGIVIGPRELDWVGLEFCLDPRSAKLIVDGYSSILPMPDLGPVRFVYRYFYRLLGVQGDEPLDEWMAYPILY